MIEKIQSKNYVVVIDQDRDKLLTLLMATIVSDHRIGMKFISACQKEGLLQVQADFFKEIDDKCHALNWCMDPNCERKKK